MSSIQCLNLTQHNTMQEGNYRKFESMIRRPVLKLKFDKNGMEHIC